MTEMRRDLVYSLRTLRKNPVFTAAALLALALGIGANTAVFSVVEALLNFPLPIDDPQRITLVFSQNASLNATQNPVSMPDYLDWRRQSQSFERMAAMKPAGYNLSGRGEPLRVQAFQVTSGFFASLGQELALGRPFREEENRPGARKAVILSHSFWQQNFGGEDCVLGQTVSLDGDSYTVVGVAPQEFFFPDRSTALWVPLTLDPNRHQRDERDLLVLGRLMPEISVKQASVEMQSIARSIEEAHPDTQQGWTVKVVNLLDDFINDAALALTMLYGSITFVLLIACANVANLLLARAATRQKEIALRSTLGAGRLRLVRQLLTESLVLALSGGVLGLILGLLGMKALRGMLAPDPNIGFLAEQMNLSGAILAHTVGISLLAGILFGLVPALQISRIDVNETLKEGGRTTTGGSRQRRLRSGLVVAEVALSLALLGVSGTFIRAFNHLYSADPGFRPEGLLTLQINLSESGDAEPAQSAAFFRQALERLDQLPGVESASATTTLPLTLFPGTLNARMTAEGSAEDPGSNTPNAIRLVVSPQYFETLNIPLLEGRALTEQETQDSFAAAVISQAAARRFWPGGSPLGKRFQMGSGDDRWWTVVGVSGDVQNHMHSMRFPTLAVPQVFLSMAQLPVRSSFVVLSTQVEPLSLAQAARRTVWGIDSNQPVENIFSMEQVIARIDTQNAFFVNILTGLAVIALLLASVGIYGVISYSVNQRSHEIGLRMALGARSRDILLMVARQGAVLAAIGLPFGVVGSYAFVQLMSSQLEGLSAGGATGLSTFLAVSLILLAVAQMASYLPARRAVRIDPLHALRYE